MVNRDLTWSEVAEHGYLSEEVLNDVPQYCECGSEIKFTEELTQCYCSNEKCFYKIATRLENMAKAMQVDGWGESTCVSLVRSYKMQSPFQALLATKLVERGVNTGIAGFAAKVNALVDKSKEETELWKMVQYASLPGIDSTAYKLFKNYETVDEFYSDMEKKDSAAFVAKLLGNKDIGIQARQIASTLVEHKDELQFGEKMFNIKSKESVGVEVRIAITGGVYGYKNKQDFINHINKLFGGKIEAVWDKTVTRETDILVCDGDAGSSKFRKAVSMNQSGMERAESTKSNIYGNDYIFIGTSEEVLNCLAGAVEEW